MYKRIRAPRGHGEVVIDPPFGPSKQLAESNRLLREQQDCDVQGQALSHLISQARRECLRDAVQYTAAYRDVEAPADHTVPFVLAGHQPQLFHAGVWFKNFALSSLGKELGACAINLLIDNDILRNPSIRVPTGPPPRSHIATIAFDQPTHPIPYEERTIQDDAAFASFGHHVEQTAADFEPRPLVHRMWPLAVESARRCQNLGRAIGEARHRLEGLWGQETLELPLSVVCQTRSFARFVTHLLANLQRFRDVYNTSLAEYRKANHVRSRSHPVPDLAIDGEWLEAPFWVWTSNVPHRQRLFVRSFGNELELTDRGRIQLRLALSTDRDAGRAIDQLAEQAEQGIKIRPRALITTMYARFVLSDLFLHGIGGAKYDQLTDLIINRFFGVQPPQFVTLSATALLFEDVTPVIYDELQQTKRFLREFRYHPERHVEPTAEVGRLIAEKREWIQSTPPRGQRLERHQGIQRVNLALQPYLAAQQSKLSLESARLTTELRQQTLLASREFSFCLFSEETLRPLLLDLSRLAP